jgi:hypothetical protein
VNDDPLAGCKNCGRQYATGEKFWWCPDCKYSCCQECSDWWGDDEHEHFHVTKRAGPLIGKVLLTLPHGISRYLVTLFE